MVVHSTFLLHFTLLRCTYILLWFSNDAYSSFKSCGIFFYYCGGIWLDSCKIPTPKLCLVMTWILSSELIFHCNFFSFFRKRVLQFYVIFIVLVKLTSFKAKFVQGCIFFFINRFSSMAFQRLPEGFLRGFLGTSQAAL